MPGLKVALIKPPIKDHKFRGMGVYTDSLFKHLKKIPQLNINLLDYNDGVTDYDLVHYPYFDPFFLTLPLIKKKPVVVTVHDLIPLKFPEHFPKGIKGSLKWFRQKMSLKNADMIITDSIASQNDIAVLTGINISKIKVIYLGVDESFKVIDDKTKLERVKTEYRLPEKYILHVGDVNYNKNIPGLIKAFHKTIQKNDNLYLLLIGNGFVNNSAQLRELEELITELKLKRRIKRIGYIPREDLISFYNQAVAYLQISYAEGFGLPVLEAMACGCPVIASDISSLPELVSDAGLLVDPQNITGISKRIEDVYKEAELRKELCIKGLKNVKNFSWSKCAEMTVNVYRQLL